MLKLRKVELLGFKSFCEKTAIKFSGTGITCIVGPNGCGKSNIVDGISWVLGEQSHKSLRAERMSDCISNGTAKRAPMGMAEVALTLVDPELAEAAAKVLERQDAEENGIVPSAASPEQDATPAASEAAPDQLDPIVTDPAADSSTETLAEAAPETPAMPVRKKRAADKPAIHTKPGEVIIGRRLYRSGQSEYSINGRTVRLRDVQEMFMGMGLGPDSYAIIEQGRIGQILSSKPMERRAILEEAAGISKYKAKKRLAEAKLESSKINLARVNDILTEVEKQLGSLKRQASKARRYAELREQMRGLLRVVLGSKACELDTEAERLAAQLSQIAEAERNKAHELAQIEAEQDRLNARAYELDGELRQNTNLLNHCALELDRSENRIGFNRQRLEELETRLRQMASESDQVDRQANDLQARLAAQQQSTVTLREQHLAIARHVAALAEHGQALANEQHDLETRIEELRRTSAQLLEELARLEADLLHAEEAGSQQIQSLAREEEAAQQAEGECAKHAQQAQTAEAEWDAAQARAQQFDSAVRELQFRLAENRRNHQQTAERYDQLREELAQARARRGSLEQILKDRAYSADAVQKLFAANGEGEKRGFRAVGLLADYAEVEQHYESAIEQFLRDELEYVVVETFDHARAGIALLRGEVGGRATFFVDSLRNLQISARDPAIFFPTEPGVVSRLDQLVDFRDPLGPAAKRFLPRLESAFLVETTAVAERLASENPQHHFVTVDGICYHGRMVTGGRAGDAGPLALKRELRQLEAESARLTGTANESQTQLDQLQAELRAGEQSLERAMVDHVEAQRALVTATHQRELAQAELVRANQQAERARNETARLRAELEALQQKQARARELQAQAMLSRSNKEDQSAVALERLAALRTEIQAHQEQLSARRAELATLAERLASAESAEQRLLEQCRESEQRSSELRDSQTALLQEQMEMQASTAATLQQIEQFRADKARLEQNKEQLDQEYDQARSRSAGLDDTLRTTRQTLGELRDQRGQLEVERARNDSDRDHLRETCQNELNSQPEELIAQGSLIQGEELAAAEANYREMKARVEAMGPVNMMALEEYQQCEGRHAFMARERDDLVQSIADTQQAITELDEVSRQKFEQAFAAINRNFAEAFAALFGGGTGEMRLGESDGTSEPGLDVVAQPPGKRLQNVLLLSGGEKALTALALLIAIFRYQPSPFCILDEVDAPLDEANVGRFNRMLAQMGEQTQFIIVTHNRRTMETAPVLYGVTMQEPGVSKLVSVRWEEPKTNAA